MLYPTERLILKKAFPNRVDTLESWESMATQNVRDRAKTLFLELEENLKNSSCCCRLFYRLNVGANAKKWALAKDLEIVARDLDKRIKGGPSAVLEEFFDSVRQAAADVTVGLFSKSGPRFTKYYHGTY